MRNNILQSIIEMTRQRDLDSLEYTLVATVAELVPVARVVLYKPVENAQAGKVEELVRLETRADDAGVTGYTWNESCVVDADRYLQKCLQNRQLLEYEDPPGLKNLLMPIFSDGKLFGALSLGSYKDLSPFVLLLDGIVKIYSNNLTLLNESERDKLTGLLNRRTFDRKLTRLLELQGRKKAKYAENKSSGERRKPERDSQAWLAILDIDYFKRINDTYGHLYGDEVILTLSQKMKRCFRNSDLLFRFGGEEFVIILEPIPLEMAAMVLERFRKTISEHDFPQIGKVTVSIGFTGIRENDYPPTILDNADKALYYAKEHGRDRICNYETLVAEGKLVEQDRSGAVDLF